MIRRRDMLGLLGAATLGGCDAIGGLLHRDREATTDDPLTPEAAWPGYHVSAQLPLPPDGWSLVVGGKVDRMVRLSLDELRALPATTARIRMHAARGWSAVAEWTGVTIAELAKLVGARDVPYVEMRSFDAPDAVARAYWSSWDRASAFHPQTIVAYAMNGRPLTPKHGAPCRVVGAVKLGYKQVKYLTEISFLDRKTGGYWESRGHEWFAGV